MKKSVLFFSLVLSKKSLVRQLIGAEAGVEVINRKQRNGPTGKVDLMFF
jgi:replicative DNA helicase